MSRIDRALEEARSRLRRLSAREVPAALARGAVFSAGRDGGMSAISRTKGLT